VLTDQRADGVGAGIAEFRDEHKVKQVVMAIYPGEEVDFLNEIQKPGDIHQTEERRGYGENAGGVAL